MSTSLVGGRKIETGISTSNIDIPQLYTYDEEVDLEPYEVMLNRAHAHGVDRSKLKSIIEDISKVRDRGEVLYKLSQYFGYNNATPRKGSRMYEHAKKELVLKPWMFIGGRGQEE